MYETIDEKIPTQPLIAEVRRLAAERGDVRYLPEHCRYTEGSCSDGSCGCVIGQALLNIGVPQARLAELDGGGGCGVGELFEAGWFDVSEASEACEWLRSVQNFQDEHHDGDRTKDRYTWAEAVARTDAGDNPE
jgi:hypothetical protein